MMTRRELLRASAGLAAATFAAPLLRAQAKALKREFNIREFGAIGNGTTLDTAAIQRAIDEAAAVGGGSRVIVPGGKKFLIGALTLRSGVELHLADDTELLVSTEPKDFGGRAALNALDATGLRLTGTGRINGQPLNSPKLIRFHELTEDEYFVTEDGATAGVTFENTSATEPLVALRYFGPEVNPSAPKMGAYRNNAFA